MHVSKAPMDIAVVSTDDSEYAADKNELSMQELTHIRDSIEAMSKFNQIEVLKLLQKDNVVLNENKYGIHINLTDMNTESLRQLQRFMDYVQTQEQCLNTVEKQKETFKNTYFGSTVAMTKDSSSSSSSSATIRKTESSVTRSEMSSV